MMAACRVELLGVLQVRFPSRTSSGFKTKKIAELLAYLAFHYGRACTREELADVLWPDEYDASAQANRLSNALSDLRAQLEPAGVPRGSILLADRFTVRLRPETVAVDVADFKASILSAGKAGSTRERRDHQMSAYEAYPGPLAPILDSDWVRAERVRLDDLFGVLLSDLCRTCEQAGDLAAAVCFAGRLLDLDPFSESAHAELIRLYLLAGKETTARRQLQDLEVRLAELDATPSRETLGLFENVRRISVGQLTSVESVPAPESPAPRRNLPSPATRFFGRAREISEIVEILREDDTRLMVLLGTGGSGKTRLSIEVAEACLRSFGWTALFVGLAEVSDAGFIPDAILTAMGLPRSPSLSALDQVVSGLRANASVLVLDNLEHLVEDVLPLFQRLITEVATIKILVTSRQSFDLAGRREYFVPPLPLPEEGGSAESIIANPSVALFVDRAQNVSTDFRLTDRNAAAVSELCRRLDGIPLAIELAAGWSKTLTPKQMLAQLARRFEFLVSRRRDVPVRHQKLLAIVEAGYMQLPPPLRTFFLRLSVFPADWTREAARAVSGDESAHDLLHELLERSLVVTSGRPNRFSMLETIKEFGSFRIATEERDAAAERHALYYLELAKSIGHDPLGYHTAAHISGFAEELPNIRTALAWSIEHDRGHEGLELMFHSTEAWLACGLTDEAARWLDRLYEVRTRHVVDPRTRALTLRGQIRFLLEKGTDYRIVPLLKECLEAFRELGEDRGIAGTLVNLAYIAPTMEEALAYVDEALPYASRSGDYALMSRSLTARGFVLEKLGQVEGARGCLREAVEVIRKQGPFSGQVRPYVRCGFLELREGNLDAAEEYGLEALKRIEEIPDALTEPYIYNILGMVAALRGDHPGAESWLKSSLRLVSRTHERKGLGMGLARLAILAEIDGDYRRAATFLSAAHALAGWNADEDEGPESMRRLDIESLVERLGKREGQKAISVGASMSIDDAIRYACDAS